MSDFAGLNTALSGLMAHRRASEIIGNNLTNVNTPGYSRQVVDLSSAGSGTVPAVFARPRGGGDGVNVDSVSRVRDEFLERRSLSEHASGEYLSQVKQTMSRVEITFPEPGDNGIAQQLSDFFAGFDDVANTPDSIGARSQLLERANTIIQSLNRGASDMANIRTSAVKQMSAIIGEVNGQLVQIATLNASIRDATAAGLQPNDLLDQRDYLVEQVAQATGATTSDGGFGQVNVSVAGTPLVWGDKNAQLSDPIETPAPNGNATTDAVGFPFVTIQRVGDSYPIAFSSGQISGLLQTANDIAPRYLNDLNNVATTLASTVNAIHQTGFGLLDAGPAPPARDFFAFTPGLGAAAGITFSTDLAVTNPNRAQNVAASNGPGLLDGSIAQAVADLHDSPSGPGAVYSKMIGKLGVESQTSQQRASIQDEITKQVDVQRKSVSGVNIDEEMVNLTMSQHAYTASAKLMTTVDEMIQTVLGLVQ